MRTLTKKPDNEILLQLYSMYKQATKGDSPANGHANLFDFVAKFKHEACSNTLHS
ncbi:MAG TPA: acyl-CoA-binding protein [Sediminibacterium sp.]